ncbi:hypothetical protein ACOMHN_015313 [Nucella lapillus]
MTSATYRKFVNESMWNKPVTELAGIGDQLGQVLIKRGIDQCANTCMASVTLGKEDDHHCSVPTPVWHLLHSERKMTIIAVCQHLYGICYPRKGR